MSCVNLDFAFSGGLGTIFHDFRFLGDSFRICCFFMVPPWRQDLACSWGRTSNLFVRNTLFVVCIVDVFKDVPTRVMVVTLLGVEA